MKKFLLVLILLILGVFLALWKIESIASIFPGWNPRASDNRYYGIVIVLNVILPLFLYFCNRKDIRPSIFLIYFLIVNVIFIVGEGMVYDGITPGLAEQNLQDYMAVQRYLVYSSLAIHLLFYFFCYFKLKDKTNKEIS
jgi:hypothetical protein